MKRFNGVAAIDVGTTKVCTILAEKTDSGIRVVGVGIVPSRGMHKGMVVNIGEAREAVYESVKKAEASCDFKVESAYIGVTGRHVTSMNNHVGVAITRNDRMVRPEDLKRVMANAQSVKVSSDRKLLHAIPRGFAVDGQDSITNPIGMHGTKLDVEAHLITASVTSLQNLVKCIRSIRIDVDDLVLEPLASAEAVLTKDEKQKGVVLADIGGGTTDLAIFRDGSIWHTAVIPVAGYQLTRDIAIGLGMPFDVAEEMKKRYASVMPVYDGKSEAENELAQDCHGVSYRDLCSIVRARIEEIIKLIRVEIPGDCDKIVPSGLVFTGGSSNLPGLASLGGDMLRIPVRVGAPITTEGLSEQLTDPRYATSVGLVLWAAKHAASGEWRSPTVSTAVRRLASRLMGLFGRK